MINLSEQQMKSIKQEFKSIFFLSMFENGDIYKGDYEGFYCVPCETFYPQSQLIDEFLS